MCFTPEPHTPIERRHAAASLIRRVRAAAYPLTSLAQIHRTLRDLDTARECAERALSLRMASSVAPGLLAQTRFVLAQILRVDPSQHDRARTLAQQAHASLTALDHDDHAAELLAQVDRWNTEQGLR